MVQDSAVSFNSFYFCRILAFARKKAWPKAKRAKAKIKIIRLFPFRSPLLRESRLLFFPLLTKMFQFSRLSLT